MGFFKVVAVDIDGTLTSNGALSSKAIGSIRDARRNATQIVLVTGRIGRELSADFPNLANHADALVLENGAVAVVDGEPVALTPAVEPTLDAELSARGIPFRRGQALIATDSQYALSAVEAIGKLGLDCQIIRNRGALMILPAGVTKGTSLCGVLARMNRSPHNTIAIGDAENDVSMMAAAELGVAVANALPSVKAHADEVLDDNDGEGVARILTGSILTGARRWCPMRRWIDIGAFDDGTPARLPGSQGRIMVTGPTGSGKSHIIGLMAERWILAGYGVLIVDPEGDHTQLATMDRTGLVDSHHYLPQPSELVSMFHPSGSAVVDLSALSAADKYDYVHRLRPIVEAHREQHGFPHWTIYDEAHLLGPGQEVRWVRRGGYVLSSFTPAALPADEIDASDVVIEMDYREQNLSAPHPLPYAAVRYGGDPPRRFTVAERATGHIRHRHKYADVALPKERSFHFHSFDGQSIPPAATMEEFGAALRRITPEALEYHLERGDFSRWLEHTIADRKLAAQVAAWEDAIAAHRAAEVERVRQQLIRAVLDRYLG
ncbi:phosphoglycolate phosphatase [Mycolicibacterium doricum]|uniref:HAD family hydrolase n=1 Tax=Mycolicibacterium doricum TaxID=126673 RepID=A0A1X1SZM7_9MYCO|nr:HAD hydrolase family protein [Mycolicibacterium doricum]MCV7268308.1 HAD family hydrolase [Mycolicibacterium doricum]ORV37378.1 HAD family hydrolase [Mycolicibacterium doricum]BBZ06533.1 phosphoglycolate phosphatase [Mycolicibacterium doricum]